MTTDEIIKLAREAGLGESLTHNGGEPRIWIEGADWHDELTRFAALVRAQALEECEQRDEALLRQALEALEQIARDLPWELTGLQADTIAALRERLVKGAVR